MYLLYWGLLVAWMILVWPAWRLEGAGRLWLCVVIAAGIAALIYETCMYLWSSASIRLDIIAISVVLGCLYASAAILLARRQLRKTAVLFAVVIAAIGAGMSYKWIEVSRESRRLSQVFEETNRLLFQARFRDRETYMSRFGPFADPGAENPVGHWRVEGRSHYTRLIINTNRRVWLFYQCQEDAECHSRSQDDGLRKTGSGEGKWAVTMKPPVGLPFEVMISRDGTDSLSVAVNGQTHLFSVAPPPFNPAPAAATFTYLGTFSHLACSGDHATVRQLWLWDDGGGKRYAAAVFSTLVAGRQALFVPALVLGEGTRRADGWHFDWRREDRAGSATVVANTDGVLLTLDQEGRDLEDAAKLALKPGGVFSDERIELAPLTGPADWRHWFDTVLTGHFVSGTVPAC